MKAIVFQYMLPFLHNGTQSDNPCNQDNNDAILFTRVHSFDFSGLCRQILCFLRRERGNVELAFQSLISRFEVVSGQLRGAVATLTYEDNIETTGWGQIRLETSERFSDEVQAKAAG